MSAFTTSSKILGAVFFWIHVVLTAYSFMAGAFILVVGTFFFDDPNASYTEFLARTVGTMLVVALPLAISVVLRLRGMKLWSSLLSFVAVCVMIGLFFFQTHQNQQSIVGVERNHLSGETAPVFVIPQ